MSFSAPPDDRERVAALQALELIGTHADPAHEDIVRLAATVCRTPMSWITFVDADRHRVEARFGAWPQQAPRQDSFCARTILAGDEPLVIPDTHADPLSGDDPMVLGEPHLRFYAGTSITTRAGVAVGTLCVGDRVPRVTETPELFALGILARQIGGMLELRQASRRLAVADARLSRQATEDGLTGLATRRVLMERLDAGLREHRRTHAGIGVLFGDLDDLKVVNEEQGHQAGDRLLQVVGERLRDAARGSDTVARLGGDEFAVICPGARSLATLDITAARLRCAVGLPVDLGGAMVTPRLSIGVALAEPGDDTSGLLRRADADMYEEKRGAPVLS